MAVQGDKQTKDSSFGEIVDSALYAIDTPSRLISQGVDAAYDSTIGKLTGTEDAFDAEDAKIVGDIVSMAAPGMWIARSLKALKNLKNIARFSDAVKGISDSGKAVNTINGHISTYGKDLGGKRALKQFRDDITPEWELPNEITFSDGTSMGLSEKGALASLRRNAMPSPVPLWRGGNPEGNFFTPDKRIAKQFRGPGTPLEVLFGTGRRSLTKLPKGTLMAPGKYYPGFLAPGHKQIPGYEAIVLPEWRK